MIDAKIIDFEDGRNRMLLLQNRVEIDVQLYQKLLDDPKLSENEKGDFLKAMWTIIVAFVDMGHGLHPVQNCTQKLARDAEIIDLTEVFLKSCHTKDTALEKINVG